MSSRIKDITISLALLGVSYYTIRALILLTINHYPNNSDIWILVILLSILIIGFYIYHTYTLLKLYKDFEMNNRFVYISKLDKEFNLHLKVYALGNLSNLLYNHLSSKEGYDVPSNKSKIINKYIIEMIDKNIESHLNDNYEILLKNKELVVQSKIENNSNDDIFMYYKYTLVNDNLHVELMYTDK